MNYKDYYIIQIGQRFTVFKTGFSVASFRYLHQAEGFITNLLWEGYEMNAQEAIKNMEYKLDSLKSKKEKLLHILTGEEQRAFLKYIDSFSIVLESAKYLHKEMGLEILPGHEEEEIVEFYPIEGLLIDRDGLKRLGIEEGADE